MNILKKNLPLLIFSVGLMILSYCVKFSGHSFVELAYSKNNLAFMNTWLQSSSSQTTLSLEYYLGMMDERIFGPVSMVLSVMAFLIISLLFFTDAKSIIFGTAVFIFLLLTKFEILFFPPYGDAASGPFVEAIWLYRHSFDYLGLAGQPGFIFGGPKVYLISIYPTYLALSMKLIPNVKYFLLFNHVLTLIMGAVIVTIVRSLLLKIVSKRLAILGTFILLSLPLFHSQVEAINMEIPVLCFSLLSIYYLGNRKFTSAIMMAFFASLIKVYAVIFLVAISCISILLFFFGEEERLNAKMFGLSCIPAILAGLMMFLDFISFNVDGDLPRVGLFEGWSKIKNLPFTRYFMYGLIIYPIILIVELIKNKRETVQLLFKKHYITLICFISALGWFGLFMNSGSYVPRYSLLLMPFLLIFLVLSAISIMGPLPLD